MENKPTQWYRVGKYTNIGGSTRFVLVQDEASEQFYNKNTSFRGWLTPRQFE